MRPLLERCAEVGRDARPRGQRVRRDPAGTIAVGGQVLTLQGLGGVYDEVFLPLFGAHQAQNAALALAAVEAFLGAGAGQAARRRRWSGRASPHVDSPGRLERVRSAPTILLDGAHNPHGMAATVTALEEEFAFRHLVAVVAVLGDKDAAGLLDLLEPVAAQIVVTQNSSPRAMPLDELAAAGGGDLRRGPGDRRATPCRTPSRKRWCWPRPTSTASSAASAC